jgi:hypothetical protein
MPSAFSRPGLINHSDGVWVGMVADDQASAPAKHLLMIPEDRLQESLERTGSNTLLEGHGLDVLPLEIGKQSLNVGSHEVAPLLAMKAIGEKGSNSSQSSSGIRQSSKLRAPSMVSPLYLSCF